MMRFRKSFFVVLCLALWIPGTALAGEIDLLVKELMKKGVLSPGEAQQVLTLSREEMRKQLAQGKVETLPGWIQKMNLKGDLRLRVQWEDKGSYERVRERIRFRLQGNADVIKGVSTGFGLCTGSTDPRSTNQTLENSFETKEFQLDYAYAEYTASKVLSLAGGKIPNKNVLWSPSDLLWDSDITMEGGAVKIEAENKVLFFMNSGVLVLDEVKDSTQDPMLYLFQPGFSAKLGGNTDLKLAAAYYSFDGVSGRELDHAAGTNSADSKDRLIYDYDSVGAGVELAFSGTMLPLIGFFGEYVVNSDPGDDNTGYLAGIKFGDAKISSANQWQVKGLYRRLEKDAWLDVFPDSDDYEGETGVQGLEIVLEYGLANNVSLGLDYYSMEKVSGAREQREVLQGDLVLKF